MERYSALFRQAQSELDLSTTNLAEEQLDLVPLANT